MRKEIIFRALALAWVSSVVLAAHAVDVSDNFESGVLGDWTGNCSISNHAGVLYAKDPPGNPLSGAHTKLLSVEGSAGRSYSEGGNRVVDLLVMAEEWPDEELPQAAGDEQIKLAFDTNGCINLYHKLSPGGEAQWSKVSDTVYAGGTWVRVSFAFDYANHLCQLKIDGSPCVSQYGYKSASSLVHPGSWYCMASNATALAKIDFVGCGGVDDVMNADMSSYKPSTGSETATNGVDYAWFDKNGIEWSDPQTTPAPGGSGYTLKDSFDAGTDPYSSDKLYVADAGYTASQLVLTFNGCGKAYRVEKSSYPFTDGTASATDAGGTFTSNVLANTTTWTGEFPSENLTYYRVRNSSAVTAETVNQFAIMKIVSSAANTLVALPWRSLSSNVTSPTPITAANVVMTNNLVNGDWLLYYDSGFKGWLLTDGVWTPTTAAGVGGVNVTAAAENVQLARGQAIWLVRTTANGRNLGQPFYLYGQYQAALGTTTVPAGGSLLANPDANNSFVVSSGKISNAAENDEIRVPDGSGGVPRVIKKFNDGWRVKTITSEAVPEGGPHGNGSASETTWSASGDLTVPAGQGFMYIRSSSVGTAPTVNW